jgi:hypothetical protein
MSPLAAQTQAVTGTKDASVTASAWPKPGLPSGGSPDTRTGRHTGIFSSCGRVSLRASTARPAGTKVTCAAHSGRHSGFEFWELQVAR